MARRLGASVRSGTMIVRGLWARRTEWRGKALGAALGLVAGWFGLIVGLIVGYLTDELLKQGRADRALVRYLESPGPVPFSEPSPGAAAFCALATLVAASASARRFQRASTSSEGIGVSDRIARRAAEALGLGKGSLPTLESFVRVSSLRLGLLNPDLLAESLAARRRKTQDVAALVTAIAEFAEGVGGADLIARIRASVGPLRSGGTADRGSSKRLDGEDPWKVLGLEADASIEDVKAAFRRLAVDLHPDSAGSADDEEKRAAAEAFMRVEAAYRELLLIKTAPGGG